MKNSTSKDDAVKYRKQKTQKLFPSLGEKHIPGYNWNGPGTKIYDRITLNYKGRVGTDKYWLPKNRIDLSAFRHDLLYYSPSNIVRAYADHEYLNSAGKSHISETVIGAQLVKRVAVELGKVGVRTFLAGKGAITALRTILTTAPVKGSGAIATFMFNKKKGYMPSTVKLLVKKYIPSIAGAKRGHRGKALKDLVFAVGYLASVADVKYYGLPGDTIKSLKDLWKLISTTFEGSEEYKEIKTENDKVVKKYEAYLDTVGKFDKSGEFVLRVGGKSTPASDPHSQSKYEDFFSSFEQYIKMTNDQYKGRAEFEPYPTPVLNKENLNIVESKPDELPLISMTNPAMDKVDVDRKDLRKVYGDMLDPPKVEISKIEELEPSQPWDEPIEDPTKEYERIFDNVKTPMRSSGKHVHDEL
tara:strand:- start:2984 stop:4225 length:1242 start_codon:yes stop_codon:yes gene_type:complete